MQKNNRVCRCRRGIAVAGTMLAIFFSLSQTSSAQVLRLPRRATDGASQPPTPNVSAPQVTGVLGSPSATTTINGKQLPPPDPKFGGVIKEKASESKAWWPPRVVPPKGAPNVLLIMTDDVGFGAPGTFGGVVPTPAMDRIAKSGLRYTNFHSTSLCSPSRAAIDHRAQPPRGRLRGGGRNRDGIPGLRLGHPEGERHHRRHPEGERVRDLVVRQGSQHALLSGDPGRDRSTSGPTAWASSTSMASSAATPASGSRTCSAIRRPSIPSRAIRAGT